MTDLMDSVTKDVKMAGQESNVINIVLLANMVKIVLTNVAKTVLWPVIVTDLLGSVKEVVNQDGQGPRVTRNAVSDSLE